MKARFDLTPRFNRTPATFLRVLFGLVWLVDAFFKWQPGFRSGFAAMIQGMVISQPGIIRPWFQFWALIATNTGHLLPDLTAVTETAIARRPDPGHCAPSRSTSWARCMRSSCGPWAKDSAAHTRSVPPPTSVQR